MRQVPDYYLLIIGQGRVGRHLTRYFSLLNRPGKALPYSVWCALTPEAQQNDVDRASHILLAIKDDAIAATIQRYPVLKQRCLLHCSGSVTVPDAHRAHPLMTFADQPYDLATYQHIPFVIDEEGPPFSTLYPGLLNPHATIPRSATALYHAWCVMTNNFTTLLWQQAMSVFETQLQLPRAYLMPLLTQTMKQLACAASMVFSSSSTSTDLSIAMPETPQDERVSVMQDHAIAAMMRNDDANMSPIDAEKPPWMSDAGELIPSSILTGPLVRGDQAVIKKHLAALASDPFYEVYAAFVNCYQTLTKNHDHTLLHKSTTGEGNTHDNT